ncbi:MAG: AsmA family protein [Acidobacteria bacterium]|nr:AsmA family protein [Acidobacteriota bacterium]
MKRTLIALTLLALLVWGGTRFFKAERLREQVKSSLEASLHRRVEINGRLDYKWLTGPGFEVNDVVIHDDPRLGLEPLAYVTAVEATPRWFALVTGKVAFSTIRLIEPSVNLLRTEAGELNIQPFLTELFGARETGTDLPEIKVRGGRINFKQGHRKHVLYFTNTDMELWPTETSGFNIRILTDAARTDRQPLGYGSFSAYGRLRFLPQNEPELDMTLDLDRNALADVLVLFEGRRVDMSGRISARTKLIGPLSKLKLDGRLDLEGFQRWNIPGLKPGAMTLFYTGQADLPKQTIRLGSVVEEKSGLPMRLQFRATQAFSNPRWALVITAQELPAAVFTDVSKVTGFPLPEGFPAAGAAAGAVGISSSFPHLRGGFLVTGPDQKDFRLEMDAAPADAVSGGPSSGGKSAPSGSLPVPR